MSVLNESAKWAARLDHVREVSLLGTADLEFWKRRLQMDDLVPLANDGQAQILVIAADSKYMGIPFRELSFSVLVSDTQKGGDAAYLIQAFNSSRLFAFCERVLFSTPYSHGNIRVSNVQPVSVELRAKAGCLFNAELRAGQREPLRCEEDGWEGRIYLPSHRGAKKDRSKLFFARIQGTTKTYEFVPSEDLLTFSPSANSDAIEAIRDSNFVAREWMIREDATHAKSKTYERSDVCGNTVGAKP